MSNTSNSGYGSNLTEEGKVECDASIMNDAQEFGSVGAVTGIKLFEEEQTLLISTLGVKNPIQLAHIVLQNARSSQYQVNGRVPPLLETFCLQWSAPLITFRCLVSAGAYNFVTKQKKRIDLLIPPENLVSEQAKQQWTHWLQRVQHPVSENPAETLRESETVFTQDTVGAIAAGNGCMAAGVSR